MECDEAQAMRYFRAAAKRGHPEALFEVGMHVLMKRGQREAAERLLQESADGGCADAAYNLAVLNDAGVTSSADEHRTVQMYEAAAALGSAEAEYNLGLMVLDSDPVVAIERIGRAADRGLPEAFHTLALQHLDPSTPLDDKDADATVDLLQRAVSSGNPDAICTLGAMHVDGAHPRADPAAGVKLFAAAAGAGCSLALVQLAHCISAGHGVTGCSQVATFVLIERAVSIGDPHGEAEGAEMLERLIDSGCMTQPAAAGAAAEELRRSAVQKLQASFSVQPAQNSLSTR